MSTSVYFFVFFNLSGLQGLFSCFEGVCWVDDDVDGPGRASDDVVGIDGGVVVIFVIFARLAMGAFPFDVLLRRVVDSNDESLNHRFDLYRDIWYIQNMLWYNQLASISDNPFSQLFLMDNLVMMVFY